MASEWKAIRSAPEGVVVITATRDVQRMEYNNIQPLLKKGNLWFFPDLSMHVDYTPTHWRSLSD